MIPKIYECLANDELRPAMNYALVTKEEVAASDAHILVIHKTAELFPEEFIKEIPKAGLLMGKALLQDLNKSSVRSLRYITLDGDGIIIITHAPEGKTPFKRYFEVKLNGEDFTYVDYNAVWPKEESREKAGVKAIALNSNLLARLERALGAESGVHMELYGAMKAIVVRGKGGDYIQAKGLIMPMMTV